MDVTIPDLPPGTTPISASPFESVEGGTSVRYTLAQIASLITGGGAGPFLPITGGTLTGFLAVQTGIYSQSDILVRGPARTIRIGTNVTAGQIDCVDTATGLVYEPMAIGGSLIALSPSGTEMVRVMPNGPVTVFNPTDQLKTLVVQGTARAIRIGQDTTTSVVEGTNADGTAWGQLSFGGSKLILGTGGVERAQIDANGNVGIGTAPVCLLDIAKSVNGETAFRVANTNTGSGAYSLITAASSTSTVNLVMDGASYTQTAPYDFPDGSYIDTNGTGGLGLVSRNGGPIRFHTGASWSTAAERARITADGFFKASTDGTYYDSALYHELRSNTAGRSAVTVTHKNATPNGIFCHFETASPNNSAQWFQYCDDTLSARCIIYSNGGIANYSANNVNLSDATLKEDINPYSQQELDSLEQSFKAVQWCRYKYRDQTHSDWNHGYLAQDVATAFAATAPELVEEINIGKEDTPSLKAAVYATDLTNIGHALLARALKRIADLEARLTAAGV